MLIFVVSWVIYSDRCLILIFVVSWVIYSERCLMLFFVRGDLFRLVPDAYFCCVLGDLF